MKRPAIAILANEQTPYRLHFHRRIVAEFPDIELWSLFTHEHGSSPWSHENCPEIRPIHFGEGDSVASQGSARSFWRDWNKGASIIRWLAEHDVKLLILYGYNDATRLRLLSWCNRKKIPCYLFGDSNIRGDRALGIRRAIKTAYLRWVLKRVTGVLHCGTLGREYFLRYGAEPDRLFPFPYEPDYSLFANPDPQLTAEVAKRFHFDPNRKRFLFVGRLIKAKRPDLLLQSFVQIAESRPDWDLVIAGDGPLRTALESSASRCPGRISFVGFLNSPAELAALYANCQVFVLPSSYEPWGIVLTEAAAAGLTLIAANSVGAAADVISVCENGWIFNKDGDQLSNLLERATMQNMPLARTYFEKWRSCSDPLRSLTALLSQHRLIDTTLISPLSHFAT